MISGVSGPKFTLFCSMQEEMWLVTPFTTFRYLYLVQRYSRSKSKVVIKHTKFRIEQNNVNFGPLTPEIMRLMFTYFKSTVHFLPMLMLMPYQTLRGRCPPQKSCTWVITPLSRMYMEKFHKATSLGSKNLVDNMLNLKPIYDPL